MVARFLPLVSCFVSFLFMFATPAETGDAELYDPSPPPDSAFVRFLNAAPGDVSGAIGAVAFAEAASPNLSPYRVVKAATYDFKSGYLAAPVTVQAGKYYTVARHIKDGAPALMLMEDAPIKDPAMAMVYFYNLSDVPATLSAPSFKTDIFTNLAPGKSDARPMKALTLELSAMAEGSAVKSFPGIELKRRAGISFVMTGQGTARQAMQKENAMAR